MISETEIKALHENRFVIDGMNITLTRRGDSNDIYQGSGFVRQTPTGSLEYTVYDQSRVAGYPQLSSIPIGELYPDGVFYDLELKDIQGRVWHGLKTLPKPEPGVGKKGKICRGGLFEISCIEDTFEKDNLWMFLPGAVDIPTNDGSRIIESILGRKSYRFTPNIWKIDDEAYDIAITKNKDGIEVDVTPLKDALPERFAMRFEESLWFALASPLHWQLLEERREGKHIFFIRTKVNESKLARIWPLVEPNRGESANHLGNLLIRYLKYVLVYSKDRYHPISTTILHNLSASAVSLNSEALALSVAIESLLEREFKSLGAPTETFLKSLESLIIYVNSWNGETDLIERATKQLSIWKGQNNRGGLKALVKEAVITQRHYDAWNTLRQRMAHGMEVDRSPDEFISLCDLTYVCWLRIMFHLLGYVGPYNDRSMRGWPTIDFPQINTETP